MISDGDNGLTGGSPGDSGGPSQSTTGLVGTVQAGADAASEPAGSPANGQSDPAEPDGSEAQPVSRLIGSGDPSRTTAPALDLVAGTDPNESLVTASQSLEASDSQADALPFTGAGLAFFVMGLVLLAGGLAFRFAIERRALVA